VTLQHIDNRPGQVDLHVSSTDKAARLLGWRARTDFAAGLAKTVRWYERNRAWWQKRLQLRHVPLTVASGKKVLQ
jgi:dTDP-glucose 4,6-dehydratase